jgi:diadenosine tetraphosphatase ApaH/serine/threonine PP2A family protein phosphatase
MGHTHTPAIFSIDGTYALDESNKIALEENRIYFINPGSVGQPRDENPCAAFGLLDTEQNTFELIRVKYNIDNAVKRVRDARLPRFLAERLPLGR